MRLGRGDGEVREEREVTDGSGAVPVRQWEELGSAVARRAPAWEGRKRGSRRIRCQMEAGAGWRVGWGGWAARRGG